MLFAGKGPEHFCSCRAVCPSLGTSWRRAGHSDAAIMDEEQMLSQTKVTMACRGCARKAGLMQLLCVPLRRAGEKAGFRDEDG